MDTIKFRSELSIASQRVDHADDLLVMVQERLGEFTKSKNDNGTFALSVVDRRLLNSLLWAARDLISNSIILMDELKDELEQKLDKHDAFCPPQE